MTSAAANALTTRACLFARVPFRPTPVRPSVPSPLHAPSLLYPPLPRICGPHPCAGYVLLHLGAYPAIMAAPPPARVIGDVFALPSPPPPGLWTALDAYEGIGPDEPPPHEYTREVAVVTLTGRPALDGDGGGPPNGTMTGSGGVRVRVWIYTYAWPTRGAVVVPGGDWLAWVAARAAGGGGPEGAPRALGSGARGEGEEEGGAEDDAVGSGGGGGGGERIA